MQDYELAAWLGDVTVTEEQREQLHRASDAIDARYADPDVRADYGVAAFNTAAMIIIGDDTLAAVAAAWRTARIAERDAMARLTGAIIAMHGSMPETGIAAEALIDRMTVRKALGK